jgi:hypothetical protein
MGLRAGLDTRLEEKSFASAGNEAPVVQSVVWYYTDCASPAPRIKVYKEKKVLFDCVLLTGFMCIYCTCRNKSKGNDDKDTMIRIINYSSLYFVTSKHVANKGY